MRTLYTSQLNKSAFYLFWGGIIMEVKGKCLGKCLFVIEYPFYVDFLHKHCRWVKYTSYLNKRKLLKKYANNGHFKRNNDL